LLKFVILCDTILICNMESIFDFDNVLYERANGLVPRRGIALRPVGRGTSSKEDFGAGGRGRLCAGAG
jgi:hypothetical protein